MSDESEYPEYQPAQTASAYSLHLPFALLTSAFAVIMIAQTTTALKQKSALAEGKTQLAEAYSKRDALVKQSAEVQTKLQSLLMDLIALGKTDEDAKAIISKHNIQEGQPASPAVPPPSN